MMAGVRHAQESVGPPAQPLALVEPAPSDPCSIGALVLAVHPHGLRINNLVHGDGASPAAALAAALDQTSREHRR